MRRLIPIAAFALLFGVPVWAQHGGGHGGGFGGHAGFAGGHGGGFGAGHASGGHSFSGMRSGPAVSRGFTHAPAFRAGYNGFRGPYLHNGFHTGFHNRFRDRRFHHFGFRNNCYGYGCYGYGYPGWGWGYDPWLWNSWDSDSSYNDDYNNNLAIANEMNQQSLEEQRMLRQEEADGDRDLYARSAPAPRPGPSDERLGAVPATVLVFHDQHTQEVHNYAISGQTLWSFGPQHTERIPLSALDLTATAEANDERGLSFRIPAR